MKNKIIKFLNFVEKQLNKNKVKLILNPDKTLIDEDSGMHFSGYFNETELAVAIGSPNWIGILAHEFSHFEQWKENCKPWRDLDICHDEEEYGTNACIIVDEWLSGNIEVSKSTIKYLVRLVQLMELDCERRTIKNIKKHNLPLDLDRHKRGAAAYIHFHNCMRETRKWVRPDYKLSLDTTLLKMVRPNLNYSFKNTPPRVMEYMCENCI